jgi:hypothetical protein
MVIKGPLIIAIVWVLKRHIVKIAHDGGMGRLGGVWARLNRVIHTGKEDSRRS